MLAFIHISDLLEFQQEYTSHVILKTNKNGNKNLEINKDIPYKHKTLKQIKVKKFIYNERI